MRCRVRVRVRSRSRSRSRSRQLQKRSIITRSMKSAALEKSRLRTQLRRSLLAKFSKCAVSGWNNPLEIQMAHIIPRKIGYHIGYEYTDSESNCVLLSNGLHALFDAFQWTVDIFSLLDLHVESETHFKTLLLMKSKPKPGCSSLSNYTDKLFIIPVQYYPSLYAHYYTYLNVNYLGKDPRACFDSCIKSTLFQELQKASLVGTSQIKEYLLEHREELRVLGQIGDCTTIIGHSIGNTYNIMWHGWPHSYNTWVPHTYISESMATEYKDFVETCIDPTFV